MAISSYNKRQKTFRVKLTKQEIKMWSPKAGFSIAQYPSGVEFTKVIQHPDGLTSKIETQNSGIGEVNLTFSASGVHFIPTERRYMEDIEKAIDGMNILQETITPDDEPAHWKNNPRNKDMNLDYMEHETFVDNPALDSIDKVRSIMKDRKLRVFNQAEYKGIEALMTRRPLIFGSPSNSQAEPSRFMKIRNQGERNREGLKEYEAETGVY